MNHSLYRKLDWMLIFCYLILVIFGWMNVYASVSGEESRIFDFSTKYGMHLIWIASAFIIATLILFAIPPKLYTVFAWWFYVIVVLMLFAVIFVGVEVNGSKSWFALGPLRLQPAEFSKIATSVALAVLMGKYGYKFNHFPDAIKALTVIGLPMLLIVMEKETGSALVYLGFLFVMYREGMSGWVLIYGLMSILLFIITLIFSPFIAVLTSIGILTILIGAQSRQFFKYLMIGIAVIIVLGLLPEFLDIKAIAAINPLDANSWIVILTAPVALFLLIRSMYKRNKIMRKYMLAFLCGICIIFSVDFVFDNILQDHQRARIETLFGMKEDLMGVGYNVHQSLIAIGSGGFGGKGFLNGTQTRFDFVPEQSTDFIFCTIGEEWGFLGTMSVIIIYLIMLVRILNSAEKQKDAYIRIYGYCVASCLFMHVFINIGMTIGLMPVIGIPLPFLSYGGSSLWAFTILLFIYIRLDLERWR